MDAVKQYIRFGINISVRIEDKTKSFNRIRRTNHMFVDLKLLPQVRCLQEEIQLKERRLAVGNKKSENLRANVGNKNSENLRANGIEKMI